MCIREAKTILNGEMNLNADFEKMAKSISKAFIKNWDLEIEFVEKSTIRKGHSCLVIGAGKMKGDICTDYLYIYDDGKVFPNQIDDGVS